MKISSYDSGFLGSQNIGEFGYGIRVSIGILLLFTIITLALYFCRNTITLWSVPPTGDPWPLPPQCGSLQGLSGRKKRKRVEDF
ncbi:unnamed protein product [Linum trigynum]|uniref:Uncharacterized protein n=1 Tax=Linum trigynum TaxID=586398 RepID=A0AAV2FJU5_9ROSI